MVLLKEFIHFEKLSVTSALVAILNIGIRKTKQSKNEKFNQNHILKTSPPHQLGSALLSALLSGFEINYRISCKDFDSKIITLMSAIITKCIILVLILESIFQAELTNCKMSRYEMAMEKGPRVWCEFVSPKFDIRYMQY